MRNRRSTGSKEVLLLYGFRGTELGQKLHVVAARLGILCKVVEEEQTEEVLGVLLKLPGFCGDSKSAGAQAYKSGQHESQAAESESDFPVSIREKASLTRQAMVMYGFTQRRLDEFLQSMRKAGLPVIPLKAVVTPYNVTWTFRALYEELEKEEEAYKQQRSK